MKFKVASIFQLGPNHLVKLTPVSSGLSAGDMLVGFPSSAVSVTHHEETTEFGNGRAEAGHTPKKMIRANDHATGLAGTLDGKPFNFVLDTEVEISGTGGSAF